MPIINLSKGWMPDLIPFGMPEGGLIEAKNFTPLDDKYAPFFGKIDYSIATIAAVAFTGSGLDDGVSSGTYTGTTQVTYKVVIDVAGAPDTFEWFKDGASQASGVSVTGAAQALDNGVVITFGATTGHAFDDYWEFNSYPSNTSDSPSNGLEFKDSSGNYYLYIGTATGLHRMSISKYIETLSKSGGYTSGSNLWSFVQYGNYVIASNFSDAIQVKTDMSNSTLFADLGGSPAKAKYMLFHKNHLILGGLNDGTVRPKKLQWSGIEDPTSWTASLQTGAGAQEFPDSGDVTGLATVGDGFAVFHDNSISLGYYSGAPYTFTFQHNKIKNIGCAIPGSIISIGHMVLFWGEEDIYSYDGAMVKPLGFGVKGTILDNVAPAYSYRVTSVHDIDKGVVYWAWPNASSVDGNATRILCYNYRVHRFTWVDTTIECLFGLHTGAIDMDSIDSIYPDINDMPYPMDSRGYQAGSWVLSGVATDNIVNTFDSAAMIGIFTTGEAKFEDSVTMVDRVRIKASLAGYSTIPSARVGSRMEENDGVVWTNPTNVGSNGYVDLRSSGRYHRVEITIGDSNGIQEIEVEAGERGVR